MNTLALRIAALALLLALPAGAQDGSRTEAPSENQSPPILVVGAPEGAHQPNLVIDEQDTMHLVYFKPTRENNRRKGNIWYVTHETGDGQTGGSETGGRGWSEPVRVNSKEDTAHQFSLPQIRLGEGRVHVAWVQLKPWGIWYTRWPRGSSRFSRQTNLLRGGANGIEAGPGLVVDGDDVWVTWHEGNFRHEEKRVVLMRQSKNGGKSFGSAKRINPKGSGACACCGLAATLSTDGNLLVAFRGAREMVHRDIILLESDDGGEDFDDRVITQWEIKGCPTAMVGLWTQPGVGTRIAWEYKKNILFADVNEPGQSFQVPKGEKQVLKHPAIAVNQRGETLVAWTQWRRRDRFLGWQIFDAEGKPTEWRSKRKVRTGLGGCSAVGVLSDGRFVLVR